MSGRLGDDSSSDQVPGHESSVFAAAYDVFVGRCETRPYPVFGIHMSFEGLQETAVRFVKQAYG
jgi:hypothetical protein